MNAPILDTNTLVRFITGEPPDMAEAVAKLVRQSDTGKCRLTLLPLVAAETIFVLTSFYKQSRKPVCQAMRHFVESPGIQVQEQSRILDALSIFESTSVHFVDAYLAATARDLDQPVVSFDRDFKKISGIEWINPSDLCG